MDSGDTQAIVDGLAEVRSAIADLTAVVGELLAAVQKVDESTKESAQQITAAIQRWT